MYDVSHWGEYRQLKQFEAHIISNYCELFHVNGLIQCSQQVITFHLKSRKGDPLTRHGRMRRQRVLDLDHVPACPRWIYRIA